MIDWTFITFGLPHSGKSSFGEKLSSEYNFIHINLGEILRGKLRDTDIPNDKKSIFQAAIRNGEMLERNIINKLIKERLENNFAKPIIFDGFPRYESAMIDFYDFMNKFNREIKNVRLLKFEIDVNESIALQKKRNPLKSIKSINNRIDHYFNEELAVFNNMKRNHKHFILPWKNGFDYNYKLVTSSLTV